MKITKTILSLSISLLFLTNCSKEEISFQTEEETNITESLSVKEPESTEDKNQESKTDQQNHSNEANRPEGGTNLPAPELPADSLLPELPENTTHLLIEYKYYVTELEKSIIRNNYSSYVGFVTYSTCSNFPEKEIWVVDSNIYNNNNQFPQQAGTPKSAEIEANDDVEKAIESNNCNE